MRNVIFTIFTISDGTNVHKILNEINDKVGTKRVKHINHYFVNKRFLTLYVKFSGQTSLRE